MAVLDLLCSLCCCLMMLAAFLWFVLRFVFCVLLELCLLLFFLTFTLYLGILDFWTTPFWDISKFHLTLVCSCM